MRGLEFISEEAKSIGKKMKKDKRLKDIKTEREKTNIKIKIQDKRSGTTVAKLLPTKIAITG